MGKGHIWDSNLITGCILVYYVTRLHNVTLIKEQNISILYKINTKIQYQYIKINDLCACETSSP